MAYNRVGTPKFYIDAMLLARQWGRIETENQSGKYYLNPAKVTTVLIDEDEANTYKNIDIVFKERYWINSISHIFILGHNFSSDTVSVKPFAGTSEWFYFFDAYDVVFSPDTNGWSKLPLTQLSTGADKKLFSVKVISEASSSTLLGDISAGWSWTAPHSPDLELTQSFSNESIKTQTTKGGHTLTNSGWNNPPMWIREQWQRGVTDEFDNSPLPRVGRKSWNLKFSYISDTDIFRQAEVSPFVSSTIKYTGMFHTSDGGANWTIEDNFINKVYNSTNGFQLPLIFQPNKDVEEYAICRINGDTASFKQVANNVYDVSLDIVEVW